MNKKLLTIGKSAELLGVSIQTLRRWDKKGKMQAIRHPMNKYRLYRESDIQKLVKITR